MLSLHRVLSAVLLVGLSLARPADAQTTLQAHLYERMSQHVGEREQILVEFRHDLHRNPELSGAEARTARLVAGRLRALGFRVRTGVGGHGVVGVLESTRPGPVVAFRADMDAVPSFAHDPAAYRSVVPGVRHICGHDVHTAIGVGLAEAFSAIRDEMNGTVMLIFQPAEERGMGAKAMLADRLFETTRPDAIFAVHTGPSPTGSLVTLPGGMLAGRASVSVTLRGAGDHEQATAAVRRALADTGTLPPDFSGLAGPEGFVLVELAPQASTWHDETVVRGQVMTAGSRHRDRAKATVLAALDALDLPGVTLETEYDERFMAGVTNDAALVQQSTASIRAMAPQIGIQTLAGAVPTFSEDFGAFQEQAPGVMYFLGVSNPEAGTVGLPHSPDYVADDAAILTGVQAMMASMLGLLTLD